MPWERLIKSLSLQSLYCNKVKLWHGMLIFTYSSFYGWLDMLVHGSNDYKKLN